MIKIVIEDSLLYTTYYFYDEAGNRIRKKVYQYTGLQAVDSVVAPDIEDVGDAPDTWGLINDELYSRGVDGKELAIYVNGNIKQTNILGIGNEGCITSSDEPRFYIKDHLGSVRAVVKNDGEVISSKDGACPRMLLAGDCWGYPLQDRIRDYNGMKYKFTGKEAEKQSDGYYYFGARYYNSIVGRWGSVDDMLDKYINVSPFTYTLNNPLLLTDPTGLWTANFNSKNNSISVTAEGGDNLQSLYTQLGISADEFAMKYNINDINNYNVESGVTNFDITNYVISNTNFDVSFTGSNCHGFVLQALYISTEETQLGGQEFSAYLYKKKENPNTGDIGVFTLSENYFNSEFPDNTVFSYVPMHSGIFIVFNKKGLPQFLNRINTGKEVTISTSIDIFDEYKVTQETFPEMKFPNLKYQIDYYRIK